jgi:methionine-rich copper-binding protein CopC
LTAFGLVYVTACVGVTTFIEEKTMLSHLSCRTPRWAAVVILVLLTTGIAAAHARPVRSTPAAGAAVAAAPEQVSVTFGETLDPAGSSLTVVDASGATVSDGASQLAANDNKTLRVALRSNLAAGAYTVQWKSRSLEDGDDASGSFKFSVGAANTQQSPSTGAPAANMLPQTGGAVRLGAVVIWSAIACVLLVAGLLLRARVRSSSPEAEGL